MKKKIAIFANGWNSENLFRFIDGMSEVFEPCSADLFLFLSYASYGYDFSARRSESTVYDIPDLSTFDGAVVFGPGLNFAEVIDHIFKIVDEAGIPVISIGIRHPGTFYVGTDNYVGMKALADHIMDKHGVKKLLFVAGSAENNDSNERIRAVRDAMNERNLPFGEEDIFYSDWETGKAVEYILGKYSMEPLPDAIVCANDLLAMDISVNLDNLCVSTPEDVILTGFDFLEDGQLFYPSIASVDQRYDLMGAKTAEHLFKLFDGTETEEEEVIPCEFKLGESCGCGSETTDRLRHKLVREIPLQKNRRDNSDGRLTLLERAIASSKDLKEMKERTRDIFYKTFGEEGGTFYIMMDPQIGHLADDGFVSPEYEFGSELVTLVGKKDDYPVKTEKIKRSELIPDYDGEGVNMLYGFAVIHYNEFSCGYVVISQTAVSLQDVIFLKYKSRIMRALESFKMNLELVKLNDKLASLMEQDTLTKVKNRTAFEKYVSLIEEGIVNKTSPAFAAIYLDINDLKVINDAHGHEKGDEYIKNCCSFICENFKRSPVFRIGGDEFVVIAIGDDYMNYRLLIAAMREAMQKKAKEKDFVKRISIATGYAEYKPDMQTTFNDILKQADDMMYQVKSEMKNGRVR